MAQVYKGAGTKIAKLPGVQAALSTASGEVLARAQAAASEHVETGGYLSSLEVISVPGKKGVTDRMVVANHPASVAIELGHRTKSGKVVPGQHILNKAIGRA
ncbi:hypothetical protein QEH32_gp10 [Corynebacterium phage EmiRose]|uniref:HK97 gp10 family phage protein n=1 Tax=Corynebacterium phage EmiRose TaxID=2565372 RepID=A0A649VQC6_9CAUD|nr:hypothetical protein QEH32_gp10 [Corynebacterium phage EmiRose]QGJ94142.1 hypothetical protein SEA_EMIROSE_10 [Corynebacterium phage EmiRose]